MNGFSDENVRWFISVLLTGAMKRAEYVCNNDMEHSAHYALGFESYTHFTSPIRRYADVIVHRMLDHCLSDPSKVKNLPDPEQISTMAAKCNEMTARAQEAQTISLLKSLAILLKKQELIETGFVIDMGAIAFGVFVPRLGLQGRINIEKMAGIKQAEIRKNSDSETLYLEWEDGRIQRHGLFEPLRVRVGISSNAPYVVQLTVLPTLSNGQNASQTDNAKTSQIEIEEIEVRKEKKEESDDGKNKKSILSHTGDDVHKSDDEQNKPTVEDDIVFG